MSPYLYSTFLIVSYLRCTIFNDRWNMHTCRFTYLPPLCVTVSLFQPQQNISTLKSFWNMKLFILVSLFVYLLKWESNHHALHRKEHIDKIVKSAPRRVDIIRNLRTSGCPAVCILMICRQCIRSCLASQHSAIFLTICLRSWWNTGSSTGPATFP